MFLIALKVIYFQYFLTQQLFMSETSRQRKETGLKVLTPKLMLQTLSLALTQIKAGNNSENLLNEIMQKL